MIAHVKYCYIKLLIECGGVGLVAKSCPTLVTSWTEAQQAPLSIGSSTKNTGVGCHFLVHYYSVGTIVQCVFSSVQLLSRVQLFATPWIVPRQASLSIINSQSSLKLMSVELVMPSSHLILCHPLLLLLRIPPSIRVFSNESTLCIRWPKYWSFSFSIIPSKEHPGPISFRMDWLDLLAV